MSIDKMVAKKEIKGKEVQIYRLPASEGIVYGTKLLKLILPVVGGLADEVMTDESKDVPQTFSEMAQRVLMQLETFDAVTLIQRLLKDSSVDNRAVDFDTYFMGNYGELVLIVEFALKENFKSFFEGTGLKTRFYNAMGVMAGDQAESED